MLVVPLEVSRLVRFEHHLKHEQYLMILSICLGCGEYWYLIVPGAATTKTWFTVALSSLTMLNQSYFMPLFFFVSAYSAPQSYERRQEFHISQTSSLTVEGFMASKMKRYLLPLLVLTFAINPLTFLIANYSRNDPEEKYRYKPVVVHDWFLVWLLLFNWIYYSIRECNKHDDTVEQDRHHQQHSNIASTNHKDDEKNTTSKQGNKVFEGEMHQPTILRPFPTTIQRWMYGSIVCGILGCVFFACGNPPGLFGCMPVATGSLPCNLTMYFLGIQTQSYGWLDHNNPPRRLLREQLDIPARLLFVCVLLEMLLLVGLLSIFNGLWFGDENKGTLLVKAISGLAFFIIAGIYCVDMCLAVVVFFQEHINFETKFTKMLISNAYGIYLVHPIVSVIITHCWILIFNGQKGKEGFSLLLPSGWLISLVLTLYLSWSLTQTLKRLPLLNAIL